MKMLDATSGADKAYQRRATIAAMMGSFLIVFHMTMINVSFPQIQTAFGTNIETIKWVFNGMLVSASVLMPMVGWLGRAVGIKNLYALGFLIYTVVTFLSGSAWSIDALIIYQVIQGIGAGILMPATVTIISSVYARHELGKGMAFWSIANSLGGSAGPLLGGYLADNFSWRLIFYMNTLLALTGLFMCLVFLRKDESKARGKFDYLGFISLSLAIASLILALTQGRVEGWESNYIVGLLTTFAFSFIAWIIIETQVKRPLIDLSMFRDKYFVAGMMVCFTIGISLYGTNFLMPLFMQVVLDYSVLRSAVVIVIGVLVSVFFGRISGPLADAYGPRLPLVVGIFFWSMFAYFFSLKDLRASFFSLGMVMFLRGIGYGLTMPPMMSGSLATLASRFTSMASGMLNFIFHVGGMFSIAVLGTLLDKKELIHYANYASDYDFSSQSTLSTISALQSFFTGLGHVSNSAGGLAIAVLTGIVRKEAIISAFQDSFMFLTISVLFGLAPAIIMGRAHRR